MVIRRLPLHTRLWRRARRTTVSLVGYSTALALLIGLLLGFVFAMLVAADAKPRDWSALLVIITAIYVVLTFFLLRTTTRQAAAAEDNITLLRSQLTEDAYRRSGPIAVLAREIQENLRSWEQALNDGGDMAALPQLLPDHFEEVRTLSASIDLYYHHELTSVRRLTLRAAEAVSGITGSSDLSEDIESTIADAQSDLRLARSRLQQLVSSIHGWNDEEQ